MKDLLQNVKHFQNDESKEIIQDKEDYTVVKYGVSCTLRGRQVIFSKFIYIYIYLFNILICRDVF